MWRLGGGAGQSVSLWNFGGVAEFSELVPLLFPGTRGADSTEGKSICIACGCAHGNDFNSRITYVLLSTTECGPSATLDVTPK